MTPSRSRQDWDAIDRFVAGESPLAEADAVRRWLRDDPSLAADIEALRAAAEYVPASSGESGAVEATSPGIAWAALASRLQATRTGVDRRAGKARSPRTWPGWVRGAGLATAVAMALLWLGGRLSHADAHRALVQVATRPGERATLRLPDGTQVTLAPASRLSYDSVAYGAARRDVILDGQAYFAVRRDAQHPFAVRSAAALTTDLGTAFVIRDYRGARSALVAVAEGAVDVRARQTSARSTPRAARTLPLQVGDVATVGDTGIVVTHGADIAPYTAWQNGLLVYRAVPLGEVLQDMERWYAVTVDLADSGLSRVPVTATFDNAAFDQVIRILAKSVALDYTVAPDGRRVRFATARHGGGQ